MTAAVDTPSLTAYRRTQLASTLSFLREKSPFYRSRIKATQITVDNAVEVLRQLPPLSPDDWESARLRIRTGPLGGASIGYSSGTTAAPKVFISVNAEMAALEATFGKSGRSGKVLLPGNMGHGPASVMGFPAEAVLHPLSFHQPEQFEQVMTMLERKIEPYASIEPIEAINGMLTRIKQLSMYMMLRRGRLDDLGIKRLVVARSFLSPRWRRRLREWWGADIQSLYGFSELRVCNALECQACSYFHWPPSCIGEILSTECETSPVGPGERGMIAVTAFHPFVELEPRIRYLPGDLAELSSDPCPLWGEHGFRPIGRRRDAIWSPAERTWIGPADMFPAVADHPSVYCLHPFVVARDPLAPTVENRINDEVGNPRFLLEAGDPPRLHVELRNDPLIWPEESDRIREDISAKVAYRVDVVVHGPGNLGQDPAISNIH